MSILIPGVEMPTGCVKCLLNSDSKCLIMQSAGYDETNGSERRHNCPLIPVPEHGDLIDRDKLEKDIDNYIGGEESRSRFHHWVQVQSVVIPGDKGEQT